MRTRVSRAGISSYLLVTAPQVGDVRRVAFVKNEPQHFDFADQRALPPTFGAGGFTFELWIEPDASFPVGFTDS